MIKRLHSIILIYMLLGYIVLSGCSAQMSDDPSLSVQQTQNMQVTPDVNTLPTSGAIQTNFTQQDYESAANKWYSRGVLEYEITVFDSTNMGSGGKMVLQFKVENGEPKLLKYVDLNFAQPQVVPLGTLSKDFSGYLHELSVEKMLHHLGTLFGNGSAINLGQTLQYMVDFDPVLGFPVKIRSRVLEGDLPVTDCCIYYDILDLRVLKSTSPGMPKTGNPG